MSKYYLPGGTVIWPLWLSSMAARAVLALAEACRPVPGPAAEGRFGGDLEAIQGIILTLVHENRLSATGPGWKPPAKETEISFEPPALVSGSPGRTLTLEARRKNLWG